MTIHSMSADWFHRHVSSFLNELSFVASPIHTVQSVALSLCLLVFLYILQLCQSTRQFYDDYWIAVQENAKNSNCNSIDNDQGIYCSNS